MQRVGLPCRAFYAGGNFVLPNGGTGFIGAYTVDFDPGSRMVASGYSCPSTGFYLVSVCESAGPNNGANVGAAWHVAVTKNSTGVLIEDGNGSDFATYSPYFTAHKSTTHVIKATVGDILQIGHFCSTNTLSCTAGISGQNWIEVVPVA